jgi:hypothetical protein
LIEETACASLSFPISTATAPPLPQSWRICAKRRLL